MRFNFESSFFFCRLFLTLSVLVLASHSAEAQCNVQQTFKLLPDDGGPGDIFGHAVSVSGTTAIVGAWGDDDQSGSAYLFDTTTGQQIAKLLPDDGVAAELFGHSVAISATIATVGAPYDNDNGSESGSAFLFDTTTGQQTAKLLADDGAVGDKFGWSIAISGGTAVVGAYHDDDGGGGKTNFNSGSAYLFDTTTGQQMVKLLPDDGAAGDEFGYSVAISGTTAIVGAWQDDDNDLDSGSAYLFDTTTGAQIAKLVADDGAQNDHFGFSVAISGTTAIVGAIFDDDNGSQSGSAYLFDTTTGQQMVKLLGDDGEAGDYFGNSVSISGTTAIVGARWGDDNGNDSGSAYLFDITTGQQIAKLLPDDGGPSHEFGYSVGISGNSTIVGARQDDDNGAQSGSAYLFAEPSTTQVDATLDTGFFDLAPDNNFGAHIHTPVGVANDESKQRSLFFFDVAAQIPAEATIINVEFEFDTTQQGGMQGQQGADYSLHRVITKWDEGTGETNIGEPTFDGASWNDAKAGIPWNTPGGDFDATSLGNVYVDAPDGALGFQISSAELNAVIQDMLDNPAGNYGFIMKNIDEGLLGSASRVVSRESTGGAVAGTRLVIDYIVQGQQRVDATLDTAFMDLAPDNNFGAHTHTPVGVDNNGGKRRGLFFFDVAGQVPAGVTITSVTFEFDTTQQGGMQGQQGADYSLHRVTTEWDEGTGTGNIGEPTFDGASWNDAKVGVPWNTPGGDFDATSLGTVYVDAPDGALGFQISSAELNAVIQDMLDNPAGNYGFIMKNIDEGLLGSASRVVSREGTGGALAGTRLLINYIYSVPGVPVEVPASDFNLIRGVLVEGDLADIFASDDMRMRFNPGFTLNSTEAPVWMIFDANLSTDSPNSLNLQIEAQAGTPGLTATTEAWNWNTSTFDVVDISATSFNDDTVITPALTPGDHVQSGTAAVHSRLGWRKTGFTINYPWETRLDQFVWVEE